MKANKITVLDDDFFDEVEDLPEFSDEDISISTSILAENVQFIVDIYITTSLIFTKMKPYEICQKILRVCRTTDFISTAHFNELFISNGKNYQNISFDEEKNIPQTTQEDSIQNILANDEYSHRIHFVYNFSITPEEEITERGFIKSFYKLHNRLFDITVNHIEDQATISFKFIKDDGDDVQIDFKYYSMDAATETKTILLYNELYNPYGDNDYFDNIEEHKRLLMRTVNRVDYKYVIQRARRMLAENPFFKNSGITIDDYNVEFIKPEKSVYDIVILHVKCGLQKAIVCGRLALALKICIMDQLPMTYLRMNMFCICIDDADSDDMILGLDRRTIETGNDTRPDKKLQRAGRIGSSAVWLNYNDQKSWRDKDETKTARIIDIIYTNDNLGLSIYSFIVFPRKDGNLLTKKYMSQLDQQWDSGISELFKHNFLAGKSSGQNTE